MIMHLSYEFELDGKTYDGINVDIGDTCDIEAAKEEEKINKISAICHEFDYTVGYDDDKIEEAYNKAVFKYCDLENEIR